MKFGSLFAGIGGFDLGLERAGMECAWQVEIDPFCNKVLEKHWPNVRRYKDVREVGKHNLEPVELICGGFPCPAFSVAGKRGGFEQDNLFFEIVRVCNELKPKWIVLENVQGFTKWRKEAEKAIKDIGYHFSDFILDARDFGIPQARKRWFAVCIRRRSGVDSQLLWRIRGDEGQSIYGIRTYLENPKGRWTSTIQTKEEWRTICNNARRMRIDNGIPNRVDRLKCLGNAVVPQVVEWIGKRINEL